MASSKGKPEAKSSKRSPTESSSRPGRVVVTAADKARIKRSKVEAVKARIERTRGRARVFEVPTGRQAKMRSSLKNSVNERVSRLLTGKAVKTDRLIDFVREGLPVMSVERVMKGLGIESTESLLPIIGMSNRTYARRKQSNQELTPLESDRLYRLAKIESLAESVLGDKETANDWLQSPNRALGAVPFDLLDTEAGTEQVETILTRIEHGVYS